MLVSRHKRLKTQYSKKSAQDRSFVRQAAQHFRSVDRGISALSNERQSFMTKIMKEITQKVHYQQLSFYQIEQEGQILRAKVKQMNRLLGKIIQKSIQKRNEDQRVAKKAVISREMGLSYNQLCKQFIQNTNKIRSLEEQFYDSNAKLQLLSDPSSKINLAHKIAETQTKVKELKQQMLRIKKNKFLRERQIIKGSDKDKAEVQDLQLTYITLAKKQESFTTKLQGISQELADSQFNLLKQKDYYSQLLQECAKIAEQSSPTINQEHLRLLYQSNKRKLEFGLKRNQRDEETKKRKYYNLLLQYQNSKARGVETEGKILQKQEENQQALIKINFYMQQFDRLKRQKQEMQRKIYENKKQEDQNNHGFMLTQVKAYNNKISKMRSQTQNIESITRKKQSSQNKHNESNVYQSAIRRWTKRAEGSIVHQVNEGPKSALKKSRTQGNQLLNDKNYSSVKNYANQPQNSGKIRHFISNQKKQFNSIPPIHFQQQSYPSDFQGEGKYA